MKPAGGCTSFPSNMPLHKLTLTVPFLSRPLGESGREDCSEPTWSPNTDVYLTPAGLVVQVELAGMRKEDLELTVTGNELRIGGVRRDGCRSGQCRFVVMEINYGAFESVVEVPPGYDLGKAKAAYQNGFLRVDVPAVKASTPSRFPVPIRADEP